LSDRTLAISQKLVDLSKDWGYHPSAIAIRWAMQQFKNSSPIFGARSHKHIVQNLQCLEFTLDQSQLNQLDEIAAIDSNNPNAFLELARIKEILHGDQLNRIEF
jgi:aryl-alcohol dehydrogenase-like predicted oxidoreductase